MKDIFWSVHSIITSLPGLLYLQMFWFVCSWCWGSALQSNQCESITDLHETSWVKNRQKRVRESPFWWLGCSCLTQLTGVALDKFLLRLRKMWHEMFQEDMKPCQGQQKLQNGWGWKGEDALLAHGRLGAHQHPPGPFLQSCLPAGWAPARTGAWGCFSPGRGIYTSLYQISRDSHWPVSPAHWGLFEW